MSDTERVAKAVKAGALDSLFKWLAGIATAGLLLMSPALLNLYVRFHVLESSAVTDRELDIVEDSLRDHIRQRPVWVTEEFQEVSDEFSEVKREIREVRTALDKLRTSHGHEHNNPPE